MTGRRPAQPKRAIIQTKIQVNVLDRARFIEMRNARSIVPSNWRPIPSTVMPAAIAFSEPPATQAE